MVVFLPARALPGTASPRDRYLVAIPGELPGAIARQDGGYLMNARFKEKAGQLHKQVLVLRCQTGDDAAFAELLGRYEERLRRLSEKP